ncbi:MAG: hypothetical protein WC601_12010 [Desulfotomaculaceae bacterium]
MKKNNAVEKDERTVAVENAGNSLGYKVLLYAVLLDGMYRSLIMREAVWDLLGIVIFSSLVGTVYQSRYKALPPTWARTALICIAISAVVAIVLASLLSRFW